MMSPIRTGRASFLAACATVTLAATASAAEQSTDQQNCINDLNKHGSLVLKEQGKNNRTCLRDAGRGLTFKLGNPGQEQTAQACLTNDVRGKIAKKAAKVDDKDATRCLAEPAQMPAFGYTGASAVNGAAAAASIAVVADLFGADLDAAVIPRDDDTGEKDAADCQYEVLRRTNDLLDEHWKELVRHKKDVLKGKKRLTGSDPERAVTNDLELARELEAIIVADSKGKLQKSLDKLTDRVTDKCADATTPIATMFPGTCASEGSLADLASCAGRSAATRFFESVAAFDALALDCDFLDDGAANGSCESAAMKVHVLNRIGYGPDSWSLGRIDALGAEAYIEEQLAPGSIDDSATDTLLAQFPSLAMTFNELRTNYPQGAGRNQVARELQHAKLLRAVASRHQLEEILFDVFLNHFNVDKNSSGRTAWDISPYDRVAIRPYVLGSFRDMTLAVARSPAMGDYLDNRRSKVGELNENFGRELLELHTMSVTYPFTETDVVEVSRCFTGWREDYDNDVDGFEFRANWHDEDPKTMFGGALQIAANGGEQDGIDVVDYLAAHPDTAAFVSRKLVMRFVNENAPQALVDAAATTFLQTGGNLTEVMRTILLSDEFLYDPQNRGAKVKRPHHLEASAARALGADPALLTWSAVRKASESMGEALYEAPPPTGYPDSSAFWTSPGTIVTRFNELERAARGKDGFSFTYPVSGGTSAEIVDALIAQLLPGGASSDTRLTAIALVDAVEAAGGNDNKRLQQAGAFLLSSPEFLHH